MPRLEIISVEDGFCRGMLEDLKQYASIPDDSRDAMLTRILRNAALRVQEYADRPFLETTVKVTAVVKKSSRMEVSSSSSIPLIFAISVAWKRCSSICFKCVSRSSSAFCPLTKLPLPV